MNASPTSSPLPASPIQPKELASDRVFRVHEAHCLGHEEPREQTVAECRERLQKQQYYGE